jgi:hypothetical protein
VPLSNEEVDRRTTFIVQRTLTDSSRRKKNAIISGLPENALQGDRAEFVRLFEEHLSPKPLVAENGCKRIGRAQSGRPRKLLVQLRTELSASTVLQAARQLRDLQEEHIANNIYINPHLSPATAQLVYETRERRDNVTGRSTA